MTAVRESASVSPSTVTRFSKGEVGASRRSPRKGQRTSKVRTMRIDPRIMRYLHENGVDFRCVEVVSSTEVIVHNHRIN